MDQNSGRDAINDGSENQEKRRDHRTNFIRLARYAMRIWLELVVLGCSWFGERFIQLRFAPIGPVPVNDATLGRFIDCGN